MQFDPEALNASIGKLLNVKPERLYLAHYGKVEQPATLAPSLLAQIDDYVDIAKTTQGTVTDESLEATLIVRLSEYIFQRVRAV